MRPPPLSFYLFAFLLVFQGRSFAAGDDAKPAGGVLFQNVCAACHGAEGQGAEPLKAPSIAGQPAWYVLRQLDNFREGRRGLDASEPQAMIMAAMVKALAPPQLEQVAAFIATLRPVSSGPALVKDANLGLGRELFQERCMECHRYNASGEMTFGSPPLVGLPDWYLLAQIRKFKTGGRGVTAGDLYGAKMVFSAQFIESDEALHGVVAYILTLNPKPALEENIETLFREVPAK